MFGISTVVHCEGEGAFYLFFSQFLGGGVSGLSVRWAELSSSFCLCLE